MVESFKLILLAVWLWRYALEGEAYAVIVNGQTTQVSGETPKRGLMDWLDKVLND